MEWKYFKSLHIPRLGTSNNITCIYACLCSASTQETTTTSHGTFDATSFYIILTILWSSRLFTLQTYSKFRFKKEKERDTCEEEHVISWNMGHTVEWYAL